MSEQPIAITGTCRTCSQELVQILDGGVPTRTYHPWTVKNVCSAMVRYNDVPYSDTDHDQFISGGDR